MSGRYLLIDGMDKSETERFFYYIDRWRLPNYMQYASLDDMAYWFFHKMRNKKPWKVSKLLNWQLTEDPWDYIRNNGGYIV